MMWNDCNNVVDYRERKKISWYSYKLDGIPNWIWVYRFVQKVFIFLFAYIIFWRIFEYSFFRLLFRDVRLQRTWKFSSLKQSWYYNEKKKHFVSGLLWIFFRLKWLYNLHVGLKHFQSQKKIIRSHHSF